MTLTEGGVSDIMTLTEGVGGSVFDLMTLTEGGVSLI